MSNQNPTLRQILSPPQQGITCIMQKKRNTLHPSWPEVSQGGIDIWHEFNLSNLATYDNILNKPVAEDLSDLQALRLCDHKINSTKDMLPLLGWNNALMRMTLGSPKQSLGLHNGVSLQFKCSNTTKRISKDVASPPGAPLPTMDHIISLDDFPLRGLVVGLGRPSSMWDGRRLASNVATTTKEFRIPLRELAHNCIIANTRYGYIQTDQDLVVCYFTKDGKEYKVAIMPIPWTKHGDGVLTTGLALWSLCMIAMSDNDRGLKGYERNGQDQ